MYKFEEKVLAGLRKCTADKLSEYKFGIAVSGGADSVALLNALVNILSPLNVKLYVITVNHNIRPEEETAGDAAFVLELCKNLERNGKKIEAELVELEKGLVFSYAKERQSGVEEAARTLRYEAFENFIENHKLDYLCLAHNKNDQLETLLMRYLSGASVEALGGIRAVRGKYIRPMLDIERSEIEEYLKILNCSYRTDKTNFDAQYLRNKIRLKLVPFLNENFSGWASSILNAGERYRLDGEYIEEALQAFPLEKTEGGVQISLEAFLKLPAALKSRVLIKAFNLAGQTKRIPQAFLNDVINSLSLSDTFRFKKIYGQMEIECQKSSLFIKKYDKSETDLEFFVIIENTGIYELPFGALCVFNKEGTEGGKVSALISNNDLKSELEVSLPVIVRSIRPDDEIETADRKMKKIADILNDWKVSSTDKMFLPVFQELEGKEQKITGLLGAFLGYKDWIVKV